MKRFPYTTLQHFARKDPLGPIFLNALRTNVNVALDGLALREHDTSGYHNALEIPRTAGQVVYSGGAYSLNGFNSRISSVTSGAVGVVTITLATGQFTLGQAFAQAAPIYTTASKPRIAIAEVTSSTTVKVYLFGLTSALGAGNTWAAYDGSFALVVHGEPLSYFSGLEAVAQWSRAEPLTSQTAQWGAIARNLGLLRANATVEHTTAGVHDSSEVARDVGVVVSSAAPPYLTAGGTIASVADVSTGVVDVTTSYTFGGATTMNAFPEALPTSNVDLRNIVAEPRSSTVCRFHAYQYNSVADTWALAYTTFSCPFYGS